MGIEIVRFVILLAGLVFLWWAFRARHGRGFALAIVFLLIVGLVFFRIEQIEEIKLPADVLFMLGPLHVTNSLLATWLTMLVLIVASWLGTRNMQLVPSGFQNLVELAVEFLHDVVEGVTGSRDKTNAFFPLVATLFLFILTANWMGLVPGFSAIEVRPAPSGEIAPPVAVEHPAPEPAADHGAPSEHGLVPLFRAATTDLNTTVGLALVTVLMSQYWGIRYLGAGEYTQKFFTIRGGPLGTFVGLLEFISELAKIISLAFRLFGNIFAGEVLLIVLSFLVPFGLTLPFLGLEIFVGFMQAFVFAMLTLIFLTMATIGHGHDEGHEPAHGEARAH